MSDSKECKPIIKGMLNLQNFDKCRMLKKENETYKVMINTLKGETVKQSETKPMDYNKNTDYSVMLEKLTELNKQLKAELEYLNAINELNALAEGLDNN